MVARVYALNSDGELGRASRRVFAAGPQARTLRQAARRSASSGWVGRNAAGVRTQCPAGGHCQVHVQLRSNGRTLAAARFQQAPDTFRHHPLEPARPAALRRLGRRSDARLKIVVRLRRPGGAPPAASPGSQDNAERAVADVRPRS
jgi:hypothetical protein